MRKAVAPRGPYPDWKGDLDRAERTIAEQAAEITRLTERRKLDVVAVRQLVHLVRLFDGDEPTLSELQLVASVNEVIAADDAAAEREVGT